MKAFAGCGAFGIGPDHGVEGEERWVVTLVQNSIGIIQIVGVPDGYGGHKIARKVRIVEKTINEELGVDLLELFETSA